MNAFLECHQIKGRVGIFKQKRESREREWAALLYSLFSCCLRLVLFRGVFYPFDLLVPLTSGIPGFRMHSVQPRSLLFCHYYEQRSNNPIHGGEAQTEF